MPGSVPEGWRRVRLGQIATERRARAGEVAAEVYSVTKHQGFVRSSEYFDRQVFSRDVSGYRLVRRGDFAYATIHLDEGSLGLFREADFGLISPMYTVFEIDETQVDRTFLFAYLKRPAMVQAYGRLGDGTVHRRKSIRFPALAKMEINLPPLPEQRAIAAVLDAVDDTIERTEAVIAATEELRRALLHELLTRGVPGMHSEWKHVPGLGTVPACWEVTTLGECLERIEAGRSPLAESRSARDGEWGVLKVSSVSWGDFRPAENKALIPGTEPEHRFEVRPGDILLSRANTPDLVGRAVLVNTTPPKLLLSDKTLRLIPDQARIAPEFLLVALGAPSARAQISGSASGSSRSMFNVSQEALRGTQLALPPLGEQQRIAGLLTTVTDRSASVRDEAGVLRCMKVTLASELLNGRLRVGAMTEARA